MFSQQENHIPGTDARRRVCAYCCQEGDSSVKKITERALIGILAAFVEAQNRFRLETMGYAGEQVLTHGDKALEPFALLQDMMLSTKENIINHYF